MAERGITAENVELAIARHIGEPGPGSSPGTIEYVGPPTGHRSLKVVCSAADTEFVITVHWIDRDGGAHR